MAKYDVTPVDEESYFGAGEIIVSKTDLKGHLTYANDVFCRVAEMATSDVIGKPHSLIRHPDMPRCVFKLMWDHIQDGKEIFAFVKNMSLTGKYYWVVAHVTPSYDDSGAITGYHSNRRRPDAASVGIISQLYKSLLAEEARHANAKDGMQAGTDLLGKTIEEKGLSYDKFVWSLLEAV